MKKIHQGLLILAGLALFTSVLCAQQREAEPVEFIKISERLYEVKGGRGARGGVYIGDDGVLVIDSKMDENTVNSVREEIRQLTDKPILYLVNTHSDGDHTRGNRFFPESVIFISHENCRKEFFLPQRDGSPSEWSNPDLAPFIPSITFSDKMDIYMGSKKVELRHFGVGHTIGDIVLYFPEEQAAFIGDQYVSGRPQLIHSYKGGSSFGHVKNLEKMLETLNARTFYSGHSDPVNREEIRNHIAQMRNRQDRIKTALENGNSLDEIKRQCEEDELALAESIFNEIKSSSTP
ncbi:MAG: MBL fold metallo-hydrolase [Candidatus Latescibacteria bacterium]|nr:MBL fold metallo-hydrolase [Candidatus Latescibacterota bacterium]